jgi:hypothetical protein
MKLVTQFELAKRSNAELCALFREAERALSRSTAGSAARRGALATLENIARERRLRQLTPRP